MFKQLVIVLAIVGAVLAQDSQPESAAPAAEAPKAAGLTDDVLDVAYVLQKNAVKTLHEAKPVLYNIKDDLSQKYQEIRSNPDIQRLAKTVRADSLKKGLSVAKGAVEDLANRVAANPQFQQAHEISKPYLQLGQEKAKSWFNGLSNKASSLQDYMKNGYESRYGADEQPQQPSPVAEEEEQQQQQN